jgi:hypothetical protein
MTMTLVRFVPKADVDAQAALQQFIEFARHELTVFGADLDFDAPSWPIGAHVNGKGHHGERALLFTKLDSDRRQPHQAALAEPFGAFAKAFVRYQQALRPGKSFSSILRALRAAEAALLQSTGTAELWRLDAQVLRQAEELAARGVSQAVAYSAATVLQRLAKFVSDHRLVSLPFVYRTARKGDRDVSRVGPEFEKRRQEKLPSPTTLMAAATAFHQATKPGDVIATSVLPILVAAPNRINEVLLLALDCEVEQPDSRGEQVYGLSWRPAKGAEPMVKWLVPVMKSVVQEALSRLRSVTESGRALARWYTANPGQLYLPPEFEHLRGRTDLNYYELADIVFESRPADVPVAMGQWCRHHGVLSANPPAGKKVKGVTKTVQFADVERAVLAMLPNKFPWLDPEIGLKAEDALFVVPLNTLHAERATYRCMFELVGYGAIHGRLGGGTQRSVFEDMGLLEDDGTPVRIRTHQLRHYLSTLASQKNLSESEIARWAGRAHIQQNKAYDHQSGTDLAERVREVALSEESTAAPVVIRVPASGFLVRRGDFKLPEGLTAHTTDFGHCLHDYTVLPCQLHQDCLNCNEHACVKGERAKEAALRHEVAELELLFDRARAEDKEGAFGADRWSQHHSRTLERAKGLLAVLDDPAVPVGAVIHSRTRAVASRIEQAAALRLGAPAVVSPTSPAPASLNIPHRLDN